MKIASLAPMSSALRRTTGTIGRFACIAMWNAPFLNGSKPVCERVPSGAITIEMPSFARSTTDFIVSIAFFASPRSMKATFIKRPTGPMIGWVSSSFLATPV